MLSRNVQPKCALCGGNHTANYKGCEIYTQLKIKRFPSLRPKPTNKEPHVNLDSNIEAGVSYAQVAASNFSKMPENKKNNNQSDAQQPNSSANNEKNIIINTEANQSGTEMTELKEMMKQLLQQMGSIVTLITLLVSKLDTKNGP